MKSAVLCFSGGLDSTVLLYWLMTQDYIVRCLGVNYGQRHKRELTAAQMIANHVGVEFKIVDLSAIKYLFAGSSQTSLEVEVPEGHYAEESMKATVVPNRNMVLLSLATAWAVSTKSDGVAYAAHAGDHAIYPDCRESFISPIARAISLCDWHPTRLLTPFSQKTKAEIVQIGSDLQVPFNLTWSCYKGDEKHCGRCGTCVERREAFQLAGVLDPTEHE